jgi:hypothetical protein
MERKTLTCSEDDCVYADDEVLAEEEGVGSVTDYLSACHPCAEARPTERPSSIRPLVQSIGGRACSQADLIWKELRDAAEDHHNGDDKVDDPTAQWLALRLDCQLVQLRDQAPSLPIGSWMHSQAVREIHCGNPPPAGVRVATASGNF